MISIAKFGVILLFFTIKSWSKVDPMQGIQSFQPLPDSEERF
jgi:hypothetical protein